MLTKTRTISLALTSLLYGASFAHAGPVAFDTSFEFTSGPSFELGASPIVATFTGGEAKNVGNAAYNRSGTHSWHVPDDGVATITFETPADQVAFWFRDAFGAAESFVQIFDTSGILLGSRDGDQGFKRFELSRSGTESRIGSIKFSSAGGGDTLVDDFSFFANDEPTESGITGILEEPTDGDIHGGVGNLRGWAVSPDGIARVDIFIDGVLAFSAPYGGSRPDVGDAFPDIANSDTSGFSLAYGYSNLLPGEHSMTARVFSNTGEQTDLNSTFTVIGFEKTFINSGDTVDVGMASLSGTGNEISVQNVSVAGRLYDLKLRWRTAEQGFEIIEIQ